MEDFKLEVEAIYDCPAEARKKLQKAEKRMNQRREYAARQNNKLDEPGGPHGH